MTKKQYQNNIELTEESYGIERRGEMLSDILQDGTFLPKTVLYEDIDEAFKNFVEKELYIVSEDGIELPTMTLFSNQRFSEYTQSWNFTDENKNIILNFKTINRENNPQYGSIQNKLWNIPGDRFYTITKNVVLDDNGTESLRIYKMKQPMAVDIIYKVTIFCVKYQMINEFNTLVNKLFSACQAYIWPNNHPMPMKLTAISDESSYKIDDRQFYGQSYSITVNGYIITEDDLKVDEVPLKIGVKGLLNNNKCDIEIDDENNEIEMFFPIGCNKSKFTMSGLEDGEDFIINVDALSEITTENVCNCWKLFINGEKVNDKKHFTIKNDDVISINIRKFNENKNSIIKFVKNKNKKTQ